MVVCLLLGAIPASAAASDAPTANESARTAADAPLDIERVERERVRLMMLDVVVVDRRGRTVPDLTLGEFEVFSNGRPDIQNQIVLMIIQLILK